MLADRRPGGRRGWAGDRAGRPVPGRIRPCPALDYEIVGGRLVYFGPFLALFSARRNVLRIGDSRLLSFPGVEVVAEGGIRCGERQVLRQGGSE